MWDRGYRVKRLFFCCFYWRLQLQHYVSYVHGVLLQLQILHDDEYDENDGHDDETHLFVVVPMVGSNG